MLDIMENNILRIKLMYFSFPPNPTTLQLLFTGSMVFDTSEEKQYHLELWFSNVSIYQLNHTLLGPILRISDSVDLE